MGLWHAANSSVSHPLGSRREGRPSEPLHYHSLYNDGRIVCGVHGKDALIAAMARAVVSSVADGTN